MKKKWIALAGVLALAAALTGCGSVKDLMLYLYGGDEWVSASGTPAYTLYDAPNGVSVIYDANRWGNPVLPQEDTVSLTAGNQLDQTAVLLQVTDIYTDFLAQSAADLDEQVAGKVEYELTFTVPDASVEAVRYDCGSYQSIFAVLRYDSGLTVYVTAATRSADYEPVIELLQTVYPTGHAPDTVATLETAAAAVNENGKPTIVPQKMPPFCKGGKNQRVKLVRAPDSVTGVSIPAARPASMHLRIHAMFLPRLRMV